MNEESQPVTANAPARDIHLHALVLILRDELSTPRPVQDFLRDFATSRNLDPETFGIIEFLDEIWPDGVPATVYTANIGRDAGAPRHYLDLLLRPASAGPMAHQPAIGGMTLGFHTYRDSGRLTVKRVEVTPHVALRDFEARVSAPIQRRHPDAYMAPGDFDALADLPYHRAITRKRLDEWRRYLDWKETLIRANQIGVPYAAWRWQGDTVLGFLVREDDLPERRLVGAELGADRRPAANDANDEDAENRQPPRRSRAPELIKLGEVDEIYRLDLRDARDRDGWDEVKLTPEHHCLCIRLDKDTANVLSERSLPAEGRLLSSIAGDLAPLRNQMSGVNRLNDSQGFSPRLADFIFRSTSAGVPLEIPELASAPRTRQLNPGQRDAVAKALFAPDLCLIQGPPGTGKTTVIADICLRATRDGKRVLVASQTNLAVDNALARLADVPWVRPLRLGDPGRVDPEFRDFLAENVVNRWFATIADHCRSRMQAAEQVAANLLARENAVEQMQQALIEHVAATETLERAREQVQAARHAVKASMAEREAAKQQVEANQQREELLAALERWARGDGPLPPAADFEDWLDPSALPEGLDSGLPRLVALDRARNRVAPLTRVRQAVDAAMAGATPDMGAAEELRALRHEKASLIDSDEAAELERLGRINRHIKKLEASGWNLLTGALNRAALVAWPTGCPTVINTVVDALAPSATTAAALEEARAQVMAELATAEQAAKAARGSATYLQTHLDASRRTLEAARHDAGRHSQAVEHDEKAVERAIAEQSRATAAIHAARERWDTAARQVWPKETPAPPCSQARAAAAQAVSAERAEHGDRLKRAARWRKVQEEWIDRLGHTTDSDHEHLQALYVRHSNVVGMTCNEAGKRSTWQDPEFKPFDIVIVDEVSKATPPELILPLLLGKKAVLVGDHRQLPPMFRERDASFGEATEEGEVSKDDFERFRRMVTANLFEELFDKAAAEIKATLWIQYRMHPSIMDAVNQFYDNRLKAGPDRKQLARARTHHLNVPAQGGGQLLAPTQNLLWIDSSRGLDGKPAREQQQGSSKLNRLEIEVVTAALVRLGRALLTRGYGPTRAIEVTRAGAGRTWADVLRRALPDVPEETLADLFMERRIRVDGRAQDPDSTAHAGVTIQMHAQKEVGVITFYGAQLKELRRKIDQARSRYRDVFATMELRTNTVDRFQGMEKPIVLISLVRATPGKRGKLGAFVREFQRINVGLSRAQELLVIVGAEDTWKHAAVPLPPLDGGDPVNVLAYQNILELARLAGGRRLARQVLLS